MHIKSSETNENKVILAPILSRYVLNLNNRIHFYLWDINGSHFNSWDADQWKEGYRIERDIKLMHTKRQKTKFKIRSKNRKKWQKGLKLTKKAQKIVKKRYAPYLVSDL